ncbi:YbjN domain-containing protein [Hoeflea sp.]|uniref:YbjN domain-containing protein n=1 Tax=Hoeflea sp. TaxID=1940281 RepID=UPI003BB00F4B
MFRFALIFSLVSVSSAAAQMVNPNDPATVVQALQELGYQARLEAASDGDPRIKSSIDGTNYSINFYGCNSDNRDCGSLLLQAGWDLTDGISFEVINGWNRRKLTGRAYLDDESDPWLDYFVEADGGLPVETFERAIRMWGQAVANFKDEIEW